MSRKILYIFGFLGLLIGVVPLFVDLSNYAAPYLVDAQKTIGRSIKTGSIHLQILPTPRIKINDVVLGNTPNAVTTDMLKVKSVEVILSLTDLLKGNVVVKSVNINSPEVSLEKFKNGEGNWNLNIAETEKKDVKQNNASTTNAAAAGFLVKHLNISNAVVNYIDHSNNTTQKISNLSIESTTNELFGPYKVHVCCYMNDGRLDLEILTGKINLNDKTSLQVSFDLDHNHQKVQGKLGGFADLANKQFVANLTATSIDMPINIDLPNQKIDFSKTIHAKGEIHASLSQVVLKNLSITHPIGNLFGILNYNIDSRKFDTDIKFEHMKDSINIQCSTQNFEEFDYHFSSTNYQEIIKWFSKNQIIKDAIDVKGTFKANHALLVLKKTTLQLGDASAEADIQFNTTSKETVVQSKLQNVQKWGQLFGHDLPFSGGAAINLNFAPDKDGAKITTKIALSNCNVAFDGRLGHGDLIAKGILNLDKFNFNEIVINLKSDIQVKSKEINLGIHNIHLKDKSGLDLSAGGKIFVDLSKEKSNIVGSITAQPIQLASYQNEQVYLINALYNPEIFKYRLLQVANTRWSSEPINFPLSKFNMDLKIAVPKVTLSGLIFEDLQSEITLVNGKLSLPFAANMYSGRLNGKLQIAENEQKINLSVKFDNIAIEKIPTAATHFSQGKASGAIELQTHGKSQHDFVSKLQGQADFKVTDGIAKGFDLHKIIGVLKKPKNLLDLKILQNGFSGKGETAFSKAAGKFTVQNGVASTNDLEIETADATLKIEGQADISNWQMRFNGEILVPEIKDLPPLKFTIKGPIDDPSYNLDLKQLQQLIMNSTGGELVSRVLGNIPGLDKIIPGMKKSDTSQAQKTEPNASNSNQPIDKSPKPKKVVKDLIKGIFG